MFLWLASFFIIFWTLAICRDQNFHLWVTDSRRDGWNVQIGERWNVRNWSIYCEIWICILQKFLCLRCKSKNFVLVVKPTFDVVVLVVRVVFVWYVWFIKLACVRCRCGMKENIFNFALSPLCLVYVKFLMSSVASVALVGNSQ